MSDLLAGNCFTKGVQGKMSSVNLRVETLTCNKLSHCLFDFDCPDFNQQYENEVYRHHTFKFKNLVDFGQEPDLLTQLDLSLTRDNMDVDLVRNIVSKDDYLGATPDKKSLHVPLPRKPEKLDNKLVMRLLYKPHSQSLWGHNRFTVDDE